ncbi:MAG: isochorismatase family protein [Xanthobacteraceae bacterium]
MHNIDIPRAVVDRVIRHRGREHVYDNFDPQRAALLVIDMQNGFMLPGTAFLLCEQAVNIVPNINRLAAGLRNAGGTVVWVITTWSEKSLQDWSVFFELVGGERTPKRLAGLAEGSIGHQLWSGLDVRPGDLTVSKTKYSAFVEGSSELAPMLRSRSVDTLLVTGTVTNVCCESTARDAMMMNFRTIMVTDANAALSDQDHNNSLTAFYLSFGDIMPTDMILQRLAARQAA